jgi:MinD-like ATPase involved in chromosome partitioning or flagellar assembly
MPKVKPFPKELAAAGWYFVVVLSANGGQGKTFFAELITLILQAAGYEVQVFSADVQRRLIAKLDAVVTLDTDLIDVAADDPLALLRAFSPLSRGIARSVEKGGCVVLDTAATWDLPTLKYIRDMRLDQVVTESGGQLLITLVTTSNLDAMRAMTASTEIIRTALPMARVLWILNERVGPVFPPDFDARLLGRNRPPAHG